MRLRSSLRFSTRCAAAMVKRRRRMLESDSDGEEDEPSQEEPQREAHAERRSSRDTQEHQETKRRRGDGLDVAAVAVQPGAAWWRADSADTYLTQHTVHASGLPPPAAAAAQTCLPSGSQRQQKPGTGDRGPRLRLRSAPSVYR